MALGRVQQSRDARPRPSVLEAIAAPLPDPQGRMLWVPGVRVVLALYAPLLLGVAIGNVGLMIPVAVGALVGALVDPGGPSARRATALLGTAIFGAAAFSAGTLAGKSPLAAILFVVSLLFATGLSPAFGAAGTRAGLYVATLGLLGIASTGPNPGWITSPGVLIGGAWSLALALGPFRQGGDMRVPLDERVCDFGSSLREHLVLGTALGRHAARVAVAGGLGLAVSLALGLDHTTWVAAAAVAVLHPHVTSCAKRGARLLGGTLLAAFAIALLLHAITPGPVLLAVAAPLLLLAVSVRNVDYLYYTVALTAFMLVLSSFGDPSGLSLAGARVLDTVLGVGIAVIVWLVSMPHSERERLREELLEA